jgi:uncharacterized membrane protein YfcA
VVDSPQLERFEERALALVLIVAGMVGVGVGVTAPPQHATELVLGAIVLVLALWTLRASVRARRTNPD